MNFKFQLQDLAVRCIQRNVKKLMSVREWSWWRLYVKVAPLLNVHRTEDQLKARTVCYPVTMIFHLNFDIEDSFFTKSLQRKQ